MSDPRRFQSTPPRHRLWSAAAMVAATMVVVPSAQAQQSRESMANDATAPQFSFQLAYQGALSYKQDMLPSGGTRPEGSKGFMQLRLVAPIPIAGGASGGGVNILPRLTVRYTQNQQDQWGLSPTDFFALIVPLEWSSGRIGIGPDIVIPGKDGFGTDAFQYGLAAAAILRAFDSKLTYGVLFQQTWGKTDPARAGQAVAGNLTINPFANFSLGNGFYIATNDMQSQYNWDTKGFWVPLGGRLGYLIVGPKSTWNMYVEYATSLGSTDWTAPIVKDQIRLNVSYTVPIG